MSTVKVKVLPDTRDENGTPRFEVKKWNPLTNRMEPFTVSISGELLEKQSLSPARLPEDPRYWLYRGRIVRDESVSSEPDHLVDLLELIAFRDTKKLALGSSFVCQECGAGSKRWQGRCADCGAWNSFVEESALPQSNEEFALAIATRLRSAGKLGYWELDQLTAMVKRANEGVVPLRHSELVSQRSEEIVLRVKHAVLKEERALEKLRHEVEAFEAFETGRVAVRQPIPRAVRIFVWERDRGQCRQCGAKERLEYDHIIPIAKGGSDTERNVQLLCEACNRAKGPEL